MAHLTLPFTHGKGPVLDILVQLSLTETALLAKQGKTAPAPVPVTATLDTGSLGTMVDNAVLEGLGAKQAGVIQVATATTGGLPHGAGRFAVSICIQHPAGSFVIQELAVAEAELAALGVQVLLGRDVLSFCYFAYNGPAKTFLLAF